MNSILPTIGRKIWLFQSALHAGVLDAKQAFDASIVFVHPSGNVNVAGTDHAGQPFGLHDVPLRDPGVADEHGTSIFATWMPYQVGQARGNEANKTEPRAQSPSEPSVANALEAGQAAGASASIGAVDAPQAAPAT
jgi:hypothetical protein